MQSAYRDDLAYIHDAGFGDFARRAGAAILELFARRGINQGRVVDLGCGSGIWAAALAKAGYDVTGFDLSPAMIAMCRDRVPTGDFHVGSFVAADLPPCVAVTALGEVFNYLFDAANQPRRRARLFRRIHDALLPGGLLVFDGAEPGRVRHGHARNYAEGADWACLYTAAEDDAQGTITRRITSFRRDGDHFRRDQEVHRLRLFDRDEVQSQLRAAGFRVRVLKGYGDLRFPRGYVGFVARKAASTAYRRK
jgi:SAM-dependent methyltransferase